MNASPPPPPTRRRRRALGVLALAALFGGVLSAPGAAADDEPAPEQITNGDFSAGTAPWWWTANAPAAVVDGRLCADVEAGTANPWDAIVGQNDIPLVAGETYTLTYTASSTVPLSIHTNVQMATEPYTTDLSATDQIGAEAAPVTHVFTATADRDAAQVAFQVGGGSEAATFCLDDVSLRGGAEPPVYEPDTGSPVRVNQVGYLPQGPKTGTLVTDATDPLPWTLKSADGAAVASGTTVPGGEDPTSRQNVHTFDFGAVTDTGDGFTIEADGQVSEPFSIRADLYDSLRSDSLAYFYQNRSGIEIDADLVGEEYARPAGHLGVAPNKGDTDVPCQPGVCDYRLDVRGGWYDAGDHGKYVVNGGIAVAELMDTYERTLTADGAESAELGDGALRVPEHGNDVPDILDEARWELDFLLRMQVPAGNPLAGMVHHKVHDANWTGLPMRPELDPEQRELHPPTTAATLNLAATAAQCARLYEPFDADFAAQCRTAAETAWAAAKAHPAVYASPADGVGGGTYEDNDVSDEFYWAAAELFTTTGKDTYRQALLESPLHADPDAAFPADGGMWWGGTAGLGVLTLATVPNDLTADQLADVRAVVTTAADRYKQQTEDQLYGVPYAPEGQNYTWGSNSQVLNNMIVLATAADLTGEAGYRDAVLRGADYLFGRNPLNQSYVTGYGERFSQNQHHRFWAHQSDPALPHPPAGSLAGGPNLTAPTSGDPEAATKLKGCAAAMCYLDDNGSYATNEVAINWNAPLAFVASYLDDAGDGAGPDRACRVTYSSHPWSTGSTTTVTVRNTGTEPVTPWSLTWLLPGDQKLSHTWSAELAQYGRTVTATPLSWNRTLAPGASVDFGFNSSLSGPAADPGTVKLNGRACTAG
ncbi:glycoside hydrolase family 9 protein [Streptomyces castrisilvae]|uniref:Endoglucanase n=1 Tax=Streptomyces castrisilvae TaxID=3033811 RepID=A0ABY9HML3_9ACTN|nr:glycoside hydrolase family 9 protein [Streptomyces sp. Mut1]WLQ35384.1 glycoside hydrolase family 9 protein [Streptomyces sp. Mut1]